MKTSEFKNLHKFHVGRPYFLLFFFFFCTNIWPFLFVLHMQSFFYFLFKHFRLIHFPTLQQKSETFESVIYKIMEKNNLNCHQEIISSTPLIYYVINCTHVIPDGCLYNVIFKRTSKRNTYTENKTQFSIFYT